LATALDNCDPNPTVTMNPSVLTGTGVQSVTYTATDECGNVSTCTREFTVVDETPPVLRCCARKGECSTPTGGDGSRIGMPPDFDCRTLKLNCGERACLSATATDNCGPLTLSNNVGGTPVTSPGTTVSQDITIFYPDPGTYTTTFTATDGSGNTATCTVTVKVECCVNAPSQLADWWPFDEPVGVGAVDRAGTWGNHGTHRNGPTPTPGKVATALCFDGTNDYVDVVDQNEVDILGGPSPAGESFTIDAWILPQTTTGLQVILDKRVNPAQPIGYSLHLINGVLGLQMADGSVASSACNASPPAPGPPCGMVDFTAACTNYDSGLSLVPNQWNFVAVSVRRGNTCSIMFYVNGLTATVPVPRSGNLANSAALQIGRRGTAFGENYFHGCIDELEIFKRALRKVDLDRIYGADNAGKCKPPLN